MRQSRYLTARVGFIGAVLAGSAAFVACDDPVQPGSDLVAGNYMATTFEVVENDVTVDWLAAGAELTLHIEPSGRYTGHLTMPGGLEGNPDPDMDLEGEWTYEAGTLRLISTVDGFLSDLQLAVREGRLLIGQMPSDEGLVRIVLQPTAP